MPLSTHAKRGAVRTERSRSTTEYWSPSLGVWRPSCAEYAFEGAISGKLSGTGDVVLRWFERDQNGRGFIRAYGLFWWWGKRASKRIVATRVHEEVAVARIVSYRVEGETCRT